MASVPNPNKPCKNSFHRRKDSDELDVFEAAGYFSGAVNDDLINPGREERHDRVQKPSRMSLDNVRARNPMIAGAGARDNRQKLQKKESSKKCKQPSSPGGRLASFLNSLFHQASLKKKKPKSGGGGGGATVEEEISPGGVRRKRRSSISHFRITAATAAAESKVAFPSSSGSGFRTPPAYVDTPIKSYREFLSLHDRRRPAAIDCKNPAVEIMEEDLGIGKKLGFQNSNSWDRCTKLSEEDDDGGDSTDSSSDLFDLPNHELDFYSRDLPVYGTTHMGRINCNSNVGAPIPSATT
ncbi:protein BIG GRAIN 1-like E [Andrographis paniculata]|uniref:protein BIG GRAIN 1-like E n=1 Tax=Andrographis paniculata TaxID=175694 RepID=UPI0021E73CF1|nr:protein BIG GRAIN 1-like E [Andrographis paniculata]